MNAPIVCSIYRMTSDDQGTFGQFLAPELDFTCHTLELPDRHNTPMLSRIPAGTYSAIWDISKRFNRYLYRIQDVPGRVGILFHPANFAGDVKKGWQSQLSGCIALGNATAQLSNENHRDQKSLINSRSAIYLFESLADRRPLTIHIIDENKGTEPPETCDEP